jgi:hypothetical protein
MQGCQAFGEGNRLRLPPALGAVLLIVMVGCSGHYGSVRFDVAAGRALEAGEVLKGHRYYTTGSETDPSAILALREDRPLHYGPWREVVMTPQLLTHLVDNMRGTRAVGPDGHIVLDEKGAPIGAWYSYFKPPIVKLLEDGGVEVSTPFTESGGSSDAFKPALR